MIITNDLMMAMDVRARLQEGPQEFMSFSDGTRITMDVSPRLLSELDKQIEKLKTLLIQKADEKKIKWKK